MKIPQALNLLANISMALAGMLIPLLAEKFAPLLGVGLVVTSFGLAAFISYALFGRLSDVKRKRKVFLQLGLLLSGAVFVLQALVNDFLSLIVVRGLAGFSFGIFTFPLLAYVSDVEKSRKEIGRYVGFGSLGWGIGYFLAGCLQSYAISFILSGVILFGAAGLSFSLKEAENQKGPIRPMPAVFKQHSAVYATFFLRQTGAHSVWALFPIFLAREIGADLLSIGIIHGLNTITQFLILVSFERWWGEEVEERQLIKVGLIVSAIVFTSYYLATSVLHLLPIQLLLAAGYSMLYLGCVLHLLKASGAKATSTGLLGSADALARVLGPAIAGVISQLIGMRALMLFSAGFCVAALGLWKKI